MASWKDNSGGEDDLEKLGQLWAKSWELKGSLGLAKLEKGRVSSWVRLGSDSLEFFLEGLNLCIKGEKEERWGREWKEQGRMYSMT